jgi:acyl carrier protein
LSPQWGDNKTCHRIQHTLGEKMISDDISEKVIGIVADVLECEIDEISLESKIVNDLGADSLDIVDLSFSLGKKLAIKMPQKSVIMHAEEILGSLAALVNDGKLTNLGAQVLQMSPNAYSTNDAYEGLPVMDLFTNTKVIHWVNLCASIIKNEIPGDELIHDSIKKQLSLAE